jgi:hypothetical protein
VNENQPSLALLKSECEKMDGASSLLAGFSERRTFGNKELSAAGFFNIMKMKQTGQHSTTI